MDSQALRTLSKKRTTNFREDETKLLIQLWGSPTIQNKLYLTHRKAPVMRLLAANMQQRGFYRTPDEIKTRIRNLKCLYHRIKRTMQCGTGLGTVDPDWPHFKAMDDILTKQNFKKDIYTENVFEGPRCEDIKQELDDIDINDDMDSYTTNSFGGSDYEDDTMQMPPLTPAPKETKKEPKEGTLKVIKEAKEPKEKENKEPDSARSSSSSNATKLPTLLPNLTIPVHNANNNMGIRTTPGGPGIPFPLLILNGLPNQQVMNQHVKQGSPGGKDRMEGNTTLNFAQKGLPLPINNMQEVGVTLKELLSVQKETLEVEKQRLELDKQKLEFERLVGSQLLGLLPMFGGILQNITAQIPDDGTKNGKKRPIPDTNFDFFKENKILKNVLIDGFKKYSTEEKSDSDDDDDDVHDENSLSSDK